MVAQANNMFAGNIYGAAVHWLRKGFNVVPRDTVGNRPNVKWKRHQTDKVTEADLHRWNKAQFFKEGLGFITGEISNVVVVDTDGYEGEAILKRFEEQHAALPDTLKVISGSGRGFHRYFRHPGGRVGNSASRQAKIDIRGDGGFCALPPSLHKSGGCYAIVNDVEIAELPDDLLPFIREEVRKAKGENSTEKPKEPNPKYEHVEPSQLNRVKVTTALKFICADERDKWRDVGFALKWLSGHGWDADECFDLWDGWSQTTERDDAYDFEANVKLWNAASADVEGGITLGTVYGFAAANGWKVEDAVREGAFEPPQDDPEGEGAGGSRPVVGRFRLEPLSEVVAGFETYSEQWLVKKIFPEMGVGVIYGKSGAFKSFLAVHLGLCVASGAPWAGRKTRPGSVVYVAAEASNGVRKRVSGYFLGHKPKSAEGLSLDAPFQLVAAAPNLGSGAEDRNELIKSISGVGVAPRLIIIDTVHQTMGGADENGAGMAQYITNATELSNVFGCFVLVVHHVGLSDDQRLRGHSSMNCAMDVQLLVERVDKEMTTTLTLQKLKDDIDDVRLRATIATNTMRFDEDLDVVSTLVVSEIVNVNEDGGSEGAAVEGGAGEGADSAEEALLRIVIQEPAASLRHYGGKVGKTHTAARRLMLSLQKQKLVENILGKWRATAKATKFFKIEAPAEAKEGGLFD